MAGEWGRRQKEPYCAIVVYGYEYERLTKERDVSVTMESYLRPVLLIVTVLCLCGLSKVAAQQQLQCPGGADDLHLRTLR